MNLLSCLSFLLLIAIAKSRSTSTSNLRSIDLDVKQNLCGNRLSSVMTKYCEIYNSNDDVSSNPLDVRPEDLIVTFCCHTACTVRRLMEEYCKKVKDVYRPAFETTPPPPPLPTPQKLQDSNENTNAIVAQTSDEQQDAETIPMVPSQKSIAVRTKISRCKGMKFRNIRRAHPLTRLSKSSKSSKKRPKKCPCCKRKSKANAIQKKLEELKITQRPYRKANIGYRTSNQQKPIIIDQTHSEMAPLYHSQETIEMGSLRRYYTSD